MTINLSRKHDLKVGQVVRIRDTAFVTDVSVAEGGDDAGPSPHDLYDASLGACKALTVMWYATRKAIPVEDIAVEVERDSSQERAGTYGLATTLRVRGPLSDAQLKELLAVAEKCPLHKLMTTVTTTISTRMERMA